MKKDVSIITINPSNMVHFNRCYIKHCHFHSGFNFIKKYLRKVKPNWKLSQFDTIFRTQVKAPKFEENINVEKGSKAAGDCRQILYRGQYVRLTNLSSFPFYFVLSQ